MRTYTELMSIPTLEERLLYLKCVNRVGEQTLAGHRQVMQSFYHSQEWKNFRKSIIVRDNGCELGLKNHEIDGLITIHHLNPIRVEDIYTHPEKLLDPENVICVSNEMHNAIHYGSEYGMNKPILRTKNDTCPWRK